MTGFASVGRETPCEAVQVTIKSVNHRFLDLAIKAPTALAPLESRLRAIIQQRLTRGRVELSVSAEVTTPVEREVVLDEQLLDRVAAALEGARGRGIIGGGLTASDLFRIPGAIEIRAKVESGAIPGPTAALATLLEATIQEAVDEIGRAHV